jgi:hypothetical protein
MSSLHLRLLKPTSIGCFPFQAYSAAGRDMKHQPGILSHIMALFMYISGILGGQYISGILGGQ